MVLEVLVHSWLSHCFWAFGNNVSRQEHMVEVAAHLVVTGKCKIDTGRGWFPNIPFKDMTTMTKFLPLGPTC